MLRSGFDAYESCYVSPGTNDKYYVPSHDSDSFTVSQAELVGVESVVALS